MDVMDSISFFERNPQGMFYVGFLKSAETWFPLSFVSNPGENPRLDTLFLSPSYEAMFEMAQGYAKEIPQVVQTFVLYLMREEIQNLLERYGLEKMVLVLPTADADGCGCGCGCS